MAKTGSFAGHRLVLLVGLCLLNPPVHGQDDEEQPASIPVVGRPTSDFYNAAGTGVQIKAQAVPTEIRAGEWLKFTLTLTRLTNAPDVEKPSLKKLKEFRLFQIDESPELDEPIDPQILEHRTFVYRLRPASEQVKLIPEIAFHFYDPKRIVLPNRPQDSFPKTFSNAIVLRVNPPLPKTLDEAVVPLDVPRFAATIVTGDNVLSSAPTQVPDSIWLAILFGAPLLAASWAAVWNRLYPDAARLAQLKRSKSVRRALSALQSLQHKPNDDLAGKVASVFVTYLHERYDLPVFARTPREIEEHLQQIGRRAEHVERVARFFRECDAARFAPALADRSELWMEAEQLILSLEEPA